MKALADDVLEALGRMGVETGAVLDAAPLTGGVSSDIWRVHLGDRTVCVKRACPVLRTAQHWSAPVERSASEARWLAEVGRVMPEFVPRLLGYDDASATLLMEHLSPARFTSWKADLLAGRVDKTVAGRLGAGVRTTHDAMATEDMRVAFANSHLFDALRLEPYLERTAVRHPDLAGELRRLIADFGAQAHTVVHGDVSPKNVLVGDGRVVLLDAECATWGDPAFDVAFCLCHLAAKAVHLPDRRAELRAAADEFITAYGDPGDGTTERASAWLAALLLARVDGASPLEYLTDEERHVVRRHAAAMTSAPPTPVSLAVGTWFASLPHPPTKSGEPTSAPIATGPTP